MARLKTIVKGMGIAALAFVVAVGALFAYWFMRSNGATVDPALELETWVAVGDGMHNSNTDMIFWNGQFYMVHASSPWHFASTDCKLIVWRSKDARTWEKLTSFNVPNQDIRDPTFAAIGGRLFCYVLKNVLLEAEPYTTSFTSTADGTQWAPLEDMEQDGWLFWRPKSRDGKTWYVPAYWFEHGKSVLFTSEDGVKWSLVSTIYEGDRNDETAIEFLPDGRMISTARLEFSDSAFGHRDAATLLSVAEPPYTQWRQVKSRVTRLDGPVLFRYEGEIYAVGRHNPDPPRIFNYFGSIFGRKRTALYKVEPDRLVYLSDLPSAGDTAYAGVVQQGDDLYVSYYTSDVTKDFPWILGMVSASDIRMAKLSLPGLAKLAASKTGGS